MPKLKPLGKNIILKGVTKKSSIILAGDNAAKYQLDHLEVTAVGDEVTKVKTGDQVEIALMVFQDKSRFIRPDKDKPLKDGEVYLVVEEGEIIGIYK